jgi:hypothetical protein
MKRIAFIFLTLTLLPFWASADELELQSQSPLSRIFSRSYARLSFLSSRNAQKNDFRSMKASASDDGGGEGEKKMPANQNFVSAIGLLRPAANQEVFLVALQSVDTADSRKVASPFGNIYLPGRILAARYRYSLQEELSLSAGAVHLDTHGFTDPFFGLEYSTRRGGGWMHRVGLQLSAPITAGSRRDQLYTKATARLSTLQYRDAFLYFAGLSHSRSFYRNPAGLDRASATVNPAKNAGYRLALSDLDQVLIERESSRSVAYVGTGYRPSRHFHLRSSGGVSLLNTFKSSHLWITYLKPVSATYTYEKMDLSADLTLVSDIRKYQSPSLPKNWGIGMSLSYSFGTSPATI